MPPAQLVEGVGAVRVEVELGAGQGAVLRGDAAEGFSYVAFLTQLACLLLVHTNRNL